MNKAGAVLAASFLLLFSSLRANTALKRWEQYWVDNPAGNIFFYGGLKDGVMDYSTEAIPQPSGPSLKRHLQFF
jgi:hypothetical protein